MANDSELLTQMKEAYDKALQEGNEEVYLKLSMTLDKLNKELREYATKSTVPAMKEVLEKIKDEQKLSEEDIAHLKLWIVGEAEHYIEIEKNFDNWNADLQAAVAKIGESWTEDPGVEKIMELRTLTKDTSKLVSNIANYLKQKESVEKFKVAIQNIGETERMVLRSLLEQKISSSSF